MQASLFYWDRLKFKANPAPPDPATGTCLNRIEVSEREHHTPSITLWLDEATARGLQAALAELYPDRGEDTALDKWASEHEGEFTHQESL